MDAAGLDRAVLVGCSRAGSIVIDTALEYPDRVSGLVWVCGGLSGFDGEETPEELAAGEREEALSDAKDWAALADFDVAMWVDGIGQPEGRAPDGGTRGGSPDDLRNVRAGEAVRRHDRARPAGDWAARARCACRPS